MYTEQTLKCHWYHKFRILTIIEQRKACLTLLPRIATDGGQARPVGEDFPLEAEAMMSPEALHLLVYRSAARMTGRTRAAFYIVKMRGE